MPERAYLPAERRRVDGEFVMVPLHDEPMTVGEVMDWLLVRGHIEAVPCDCGDCAGCRVPRLGQAVLRDPVVEGDAVVSAFQAPVDVPEPSLGAFGTCECGCAIYDHGRINMDGNQVWVGCRHHDDCTTFRASDGSSWPNVYAKATPAEPTDLDVNTDHWIDGRVYLTGDEPPL